MCVCVCVCVCARVRAHAKNKLIMNNRTFNTGINIYMFNK